MTAAPGFDRQAQQHTPFGVLGAVLLVAEARFSDACGSALG